MKKAIDIIFSVIMVLVLIFAILLVGVRLFGLKPYTVISGSMEPEYPVGSLIYVKKAKPAELKVNDPITYVMDSGTVVTHRIIEILPDEDDPTVIRYRTKGDANEDADGTPVHMNNVLGKPVFKIPLIGYVAYFVQNPPGSIIAVSALVLIILLAFLPNIFGIDSKDASEANVAAEEQEKSEKLLEELKTMRDTLADMQKQMTPNEESPQSTPTETGDRSPPDSREQH